MTPPRAVYQGFRHTPLQTRTHLKVGLRPKEDPPAIVQCPYCEERVLAVRKGYFDIDPIGEGLLFLRERAEVGATDEQIQNHLGMAGDTERPRRVELLRAGLVKPEGVRKTRTGRDAQVWVVVNKENGDALPGIEDVPALHGG